MIEKNMRLNDLFNTYGILLTQKEQGVFTKYYGDDLSLQEIAVLNDVSKTAIYNLIKRVEKKLTNYEDNLKINEKSIRLNKLLDYNDIKKLKEELKQIIK